MTGSIRAAQRGDVGAMVALSEMARTAYESYQPIFWRKAPDSASKQHLFFEALLAQDDSFLYIAEHDTAITGFIIARLTAAPPVYDPGGLTCVVDDFVVREPLLWATAGLALIEHVRRVVKEKGAVSMVVVCAAMDEPKRTMLEAAGFPVASEWRTHPL